MDATCFITGTKMLGYEVVVPLARCRVKVLQLETGCPLRILFEVKLQNYSSAKLLICKIMSS
jgi:hypothetical protein